MVQNGRTGSKVNKSAAMGRCWATIINKDKLILKLRRMYNVISFMGAQLLCMIIALK